jgi:hypothetical protein
MGEYRYTTCAGGSGSDLALTTADGTQDDLAQVTSTATGGTGTYTWTLTDPNGVDRTALLSSTSAASVTWTPTDINGADWCAGTWVAACTDGTVEVKHLQRVGDEDGYIYQDLDACTLAGTTTILDAGASSLGLTSTVVIDAVHGGADSSDGATLMQMIQRPTDAVILDQRMKLTYATSGPDASTAMIELCNIPESESGLQVNNHGYHGGFAIDSADDIKMRGPSRFGGLGSLSIAFAGTAGYAELTTVFDEGLGTLKGDETWLSAYDTGTDPKVQHLVHTSISSGGYQNGIHIGIVLSHIDTSPTVTITWTNVRVGWRWRQQT